MFVAEFSLYNGGILFVASVKAFVSVCNDFQLDTGVAFEPALIAFLAKADLLPPWSTLWVLVCDELLCPDLTEFEVPLEPYFAQPVVPPFTPPVFVV